MLNIQQVTEVINHYHQNKGILKKLARTEHPAIRATDEYLKSLKLHKGLLSNQDLFNINRFFLCDHPVKPGKASYEAWYTINYQNFCALNFGQANQLGQLLSYPVPIKYAGFATCGKAGYQQFPEYFSKLTLEQLDNKSNAEKMQEFFQVLNQCYQENNFTGDCFLALSKLCVEGMLSQEYINAIKSNVQANFLAKCLIKMKHTDTLTPENQAFILAYRGSIIIPVTHILIALDKTGLNTLANRKILADFSYPIALHRTVKLLEKLDLLTQENFDLISSENNLSWLLALEEMPEELITAEVWQGLLNLSENSNENDFRKDIQAYAEVLKKKLNVECMKKDILASEDHIETQAVTSIARSRFFSVAPANLTPPAKEEMPKVNFAP
ncbi:hypothetical protein [Rickettsiella endosymbiont of Miltochrista miniata]|uniref:hypothetical protein n=1 Tax=Rickettsiella endosymbiont of Miltochrista miniata TaxID=3066239 RepID=UPI00313A7C03